MAVTSETNPANFGSAVNRVFQTTLLMNAKVRAPYFVGSQSAQVEEQRGTRTAIWRRIENLTPTTTALSAITSESYPFRQGSSLTVTEPTATAAKYGQVLFLNEEVRLTEFSGTVDKMIEVLGISAGASLNRLQRNLLEDNATLIYATGGAADGDVGDPINLNLIRNAVNAINRLSALKFMAMTTGSQNIGTSPIRPSYWGICHVDVEEDIRDLAGFKPVETYAGQTATNSQEIGLAGGVRWLATEDASVDADSGAAASGVRSTSGTNADLYTSVVFGMEAFGSLGFNVEHVKETYLAGDNLPTVMMFNDQGGGPFDPLHEVSTLAWKAWYAGAQLNAAWSRGIRTAARVLA